MADRLTFKDNDAIALQVSDMLTDPVVLSCLGIMAAIGWVMIPISIRWYARMPPDDDPAVVVQAPSRRSSGGDWDHRLFEVEHNLNSLAARIDKLTTRMRAQQNYERWEQAWDAYTAQTQCWARYRQEHGVDPPGPRPRMPQGGPDDPRYDPPISDRYNRTIIR